MCMFLFLMIRKMKLSSAILEVDFRGHARAADLLDVFDDIHKDFDVSKI